MNLPELFLFHGDWPRYEDELYEIFLETFVRASLQFRGWRVSAQYTPETKGKGFSFWHTIADGPNEVDRIPDLRRCERIRWIGWLIQQVESNSDLSWWENKRGSSIHVVIWHEKESFAVVLARRKDYYVLKTAYWVKSNRADDFRRERAAFSKAQNG